jgi:hypothetical protein
MLHRFYPKADWQSMYAHLDTFPSLQDEDVSAHLVEGAAAHSVYTGGRTSSESDDLNLLTTMLLIRYYLSF